ncbi:MAG: tetratricopeptide repeat protein [Flavobacteriales bacterium]|nr:tetratricopeptide repeat protein [Flavobacteriales bacterium]MBP9079810.1 tetratricopeptide repeat protein [Flavobacteriales bacterium]
MEQHHRTGIAVLAATALVVAGCGGLGKMDKYASTITHTVDPNPLIVQGDTVHVSINGNFPGKYFYRKALVELTPTLTYAGGETPMKMAGFQGDKAAGNYTVVPYEQGKSFSYSDKVAYTPAMEQSQLMLNILGKQGKKEKPFTAVKMADGVITTPYLMLSDDRVIMAPDQFVRITSHSVNATINYLVASEVVRPGELKDQDVKAVNDFVKTGVKDPRITWKGVSVDAYASPEGEVDMNENLADKRAATAKRWIQGVLQANKVAAAKDDAFYALSPKGEDWEGFKAATQASTFADKDLVLRVLEMYPDVNKRELEIKNMAATYKELSDGILPQLRRSEVRLNYEVNGYSDEELTALSKSNPDTLNVEEILKAATLSSDLNEQLRIYREAERMYPQDYRCANNVGYVLFQQGKSAEAEAQFQKANGIMDNPISTNNLGVIARQKGDRAKAAELFTKATAAGPDVKYNQGIIAIQNGNYASANSSMAGQNTFNAALAKMLGGDAAGAGTILAASSDKDSAKGHYLAAIIAARTNNADGMRSHLAAAVAQDASLREKALKDLEFRNFKDSLGL